MTTSELLVRGLLPGEARWAWELNEREVPHVGTETWEEFQRLCRIAARARLATLGGAPAGFLLGMTAEADYASPNFIFFREQFGAFLYVDRIAVTADHRRAGVGAALYRDTVEYARGAGLQQVCCEVNLRPPNPGSMSFHLGLGFRQVGEQEAHGKTVAMLVKEV